MNPCKAALGIALLAFGCAGARAYSDFDPNGRFDTFRSFAWLTEEPGIPTTAAAARMCSAGRTERRATLVVDMVSPPGSSFLG